MKKIPKKKRKVTELYFNEYDGTAEIHTYNTKLQKRLIAYATTYPELCQLIEDDEQKHLWIVLLPQRCLIYSSVMHSSCVNFDRVSFTLLFFNSHSQISITRHPWSVSNCRLYLSR